MESIILRNTQCPGDWVVLTAAIREMHKAYPGRFRVGIDVVDTHLFQHNPYIDFSLRKNAPGSKTIIAKYPMVHSSNQNRIHFMQAYIEYLNTQLNVKVSLTEFKPDLYLTEAERAGPPHGVKKPYWIFASGGKKDYSAKWWDSDRWQTVVESMSKWTTMVQVGGKGSANDHVHPKLANVVDLVQQTTFRELMQLIYHSEGVMCIVTSLMHVAAAFNKPCVVVAGGREPYFWEAYTKESRLACMRRHNPNWEPPVEDTFVPHRFLHTVGTGANPIAVLPCCRNGGCWKSRIGPKEKRARYSICQDQIQLPTKYLPRCLDLITPDHVLSAVESYYSDGYLKKNAPAEVQVAHAPAVAVVKTLYKEPPVSADLLVNKMTLNGDQEAWRCSWSRTIQEVGLEELGHSRTLMCIYGGKFLARYHKHHKVIEETQLTAWMWDLSGLAKDSPLGIVHWALIHEDLRLWVKSRFPDAKPFDKHPIDPKREIVYYPRRGFLCLPAHVVQAIDWKDTSDDFELHVGATLHALGVGLKDAGHMIRGA